VKKRRNERTLKKRIRKVISLSTFITVLFLSGAIISLILIASRSFAKGQSKTACDLIQQELNSGAVLKPLGIKSIEEIGKDNINTNKWFNDFNKKLRFDDLIPYTKDETKLYIRIEIKDKRVYSNETKAGSNDISVFSDFYKSTESIDYIYNSEGEKIGTIAVRVNPQLLFGIVGLLLFIIILISLLAAYP
jgi:hypothetical protein